MAAERRKQIQQEISRLQSEDLELERQELEASELLAATGQLGFWGRDKVGLTSYPRSGNSFLRKIIEQLTGTVTGSDGNPERSLNQQLQALGMRGEGKMSNAEAWCVKTHYPERVGRARLTVSRFIVLVRNPFDCILSFFQMMVTDSHSKSITKEELDLKYSALWHDFLLEEVSIWAQFHAHWRWLAERHPSKFLLLKYEDLTDSSSSSKSKEEIGRLARFLYGGLNNNHNHDVDQILDKYFAAQPETIVYPLKQETSAAFPKSTRFYSNDQFLHVLASTRSDLCRYGYWDACTAEWARRSPDSKLDMVAYVDKQVDECMVTHPESSSDLFWLNSRYSLRPRTKEDPYARGFDVRWEARLEAIRGGESTTG